MSTKVIDATMESLGGMQAVAAAAQVLGPALAALTEPVQALVNGFLSMTGQIAGFVQAFSPATAAQFQRVLGDITAVIGQALQPVLEATTGFLKEFGSILGPILEQLQPAILAVTEALMDFAQGFLATFASLAPVIADLAKFFAFLAEVVVAVSRPFQAFAIVVSTVLSAITSAIGSVFGDGLKGAMDTFKDAMLGLARIIVGIAAKIAQAFGALGFIDSLQKAFGGKAVDKKDVTGTKAASNPAFFKFDAFGEAVAKNASIATGGGSSAKKPEDWLAVIADDIRDIKGGGETFIDRIAEKIGQKFKEVIGSLKTAYEPIKKKIEPYIPEVSPSPLSPFFGIKLF